MIVGSDLNQVVGVGVEVCDEIANIAGMWDLCAEEVTVTFPSQISRVIRHWVKGHFKKVDGYTVVLRQKP